MYGYGEIFCVPYTNQYLALGLNEMVRMNDLSINNAINRVSKNMCAWQFSGVIIKACNNIDIQLSAVSYFTEFSDYQII